MAFASKVFGIFMTMIGISLGGYLFGRIGRFPTVLIGAAVTPARQPRLRRPRRGRRATSTRSRTRSGSTTCSACSAPTTAWFGCCVAICYENIATGVALTAFVAYLSGIISKKFTAVQYALLSSLTFLVGSLGRGVAGESFDKYGYALGVPLDRRGGPARSRVRAPRMGRASPRQEAPKLRATARR